MLSNCVIVYLYIYICYSLTLKCNKTDRLITKACDMKAIIAYYHDKGNHMRRDVMFQEVCCIYTHILLYIYHTNSHTCLDQNSFHPYQQGIHPNMVEY